LLRRLIADCQRIIELLGAASHLARPGRFAYLWRMLGFLKEFWAFLSVRKKFWLFPVLLFMALFAVLVVLTEGSAVAPFIYTLF
jgi:uncharacterized protein DUF5989